jgi:hypothetical protein
MTFRRLLTIGISTVALVAGVQTVAGAAAGAATCATNNLCLFQNTNFNANSAGVSVDLDNLGTTNLGVNLGQAAIKFNDEMSSWQSRRTKYSAWTVDTGGDGTSHCMNPQWDVSSMRSKENDQASTVILYGNNFSC